METALLKWENYDEQEYQVLDLFDGCGDSCLGSCVEVAAFHHAAIRSVDRADMGSM